MNQFSKLCFFVACLLTLLSVAGCSADEPETPKTNQITTAPTKIATPVRTNIVEEETVKEADESTRKSLLGVWKVKSIDFVKQNSAPENSPVTGQFSIFGENEDDNYLLFKSNGDMFYFFMDRSLNNVDTPFLPNEYRLYKISDKYIELNAKHIKVKYEYQLDGDNLLLKSEDGYASLVRDHEIESNQYENLQKIIDRYKKSLNYVDIN